MQAPHTLLSLVAVEPELPEKQAGRTVVHLPCLAFLPLAVVAVVAAITHQHLLVLAALVAVLAVLVTLRKTEELEIHQLFCLFRDITAGQTPAVVVALVAVLAAEVLVLLERNQLEMVELLEVMGGEYFLLARTLLFTPVVVEELEVVAQAGVLLAALAVGGLGEIQQLAELPILGAVEAEHLHRGHHQHQALEAAGL
jgi:hypothetical protein